MAKAPPKYWRGPVRPIMFVEMKTYAIHWKSNLAGTFGTGTKLFEKEEAERLATELNENFPDIDHEAVLPVTTAAEPAMPELATPASG